MDGGGEHEENAAFTTGEFDRIVGNPFLRAAENPLSAFSIDVDTAGYFIARRFINNGMLSPKSPVRIEELINCFDYNYPPPQDERPRVNMVFLLDVSGSMEEPDKLLWLNRPWNSWWISLMARTGLPYAGTVLPSTGCDNHFAAGKPRVV
ncbi:MAG: von Willebrand factor type A domain-containing protein [Treponema sp.]|nr:von Willebrand factor type A domain-containing protein [Treponema sp.]